MIDRQRRLEAEAWKTDINKCPHIGHRLTTAEIMSLTPDQKKELLHDLRPEFYGKAARIIESSINRTFSQLNSRGKLGLINWQNIVIDPESIKNYSDLEHSMYQTLAVDMESVFTDMRTLQSDNVDEFEEFLNFEQTIQNQSKLKGYGFGDPRLDLQAGIGTATSHIAQLLPQFDKFCDNQQIDGNEKKEVITKSYKPLMRLASLRFSDLTKFQDTYIKNLNDYSLLSILPNGRIDFSNKFGSILQNVEDRSNESAIGCPVLFGRNQVRDLWRWGSFIAAETKLVN